MIECVVYTDRGSTGVRSALGQTFPDISVEDINTGEAQKIRGRYEEKYGLKLKHLPSSRFRRAISGIDEFASTVGRVLYDSRISWLLTSGGEPLEGISFMGKLR